jgi:hypothetical protein
MLWHGRPDGEALDVSVRPNNRLQRTALRAAPDPERWLHERKGDTLTLDLRATGPSTFGPISQRARLRPAGATDVIVSWPSKKAGPTTANDCAGDRERLKP